MEEKAQLPFAVDDDLSEDKLRTLLHFAQERKAELDELDYKVSLDMSSTQDKVELAKDVIAMNNAGGGYIPLGVADDGTPIGLSKEQYEALDPTPLSNKVNEYATPQDARLKLAKHRISLEAREPKYFGLLYCPRRRGLPLIMAKDGNYPGPDKPGHVLHAFRKHDVYVRRGAQSKPMQPEDMQRFFEEALAASKESWMEDITKLVAESEKVGQASQLAHQELTPATLMVDSATFWRILVSLYRKHDTAGCIYLIDLATKQIDSKWNESQSLSVEEAKELITSQLDVVLDKLTLIGFSAIRFDNSVVFQDCIESLAQLYSLGWTRDILQRAPGPPGLLLWRWPPNAVMLRTYAIGGYAIKKHAYENIQETLKLKVVTAPSGQPYMDSLIAHPEYDRYGHEEPTFFEEAEEYLKDRAALLVITQEQNMEIMGWLCQFDLVAAYTRWQQDPWFGFFWTRPPRFSMPIIELVLEQGAEILWPRYSDQSFADYLRATLERARRSSWRYVWRLELLSEEIQKFLERHPPRSPASS